MEPFAASGRYDGFGELAAAATRVQRIYGTDGTTLTELDNGDLLITDGPTSFTLDNRDFNVQSLRSNLVLRWEWRPGSTLFFVWQQDRGWEDAIRTRVRLSDLFRSFGRTGDHFFAIKATLWMAP
jgi:hypothetical protein